VGIGIPVDLPKRILTLGLNFQFQYMVPQNISIFRQYPEIQSRTLREAVNRGTTYQALQIVMERRVTCCNQWYMAVSTLQVMCYNQWYMAVSTLQVMCYNQRYMAVSTLQILTYEYVCFLFRLMTLSQIL